MGSRLQKGAVDVVQQIKNAAARFRKEGVRNDPVDMAIAGVVASERSATARALRDARKRRSKE